jgi:hypothetical protein
MSVEAKNRDKIIGFEKGIPWKPFKSLKKVTFVEFDKYSYIDDYAYLASIPSSVFNDGNTIYTNPLLFFQGENAYSNEEENRFLNDFSGTHYLMEDWMRYCGGLLDKLISINVPKNSLNNEWKYREADFIDSDNPFEIGKQIALNEWSYSDNAVVAVIEEDYNIKTYEKTNGSINGLISGFVETEDITIDRSFGLAPEYVNFQVEEGYKYIRVDLWYPALSIKSKLLNSIDGFGGARIILPSVDPDMQLYSPYEDYMILTSAAAEMAITNGPHEECFSYVYNPGVWSIGVTNMPTEGDEESFVHPLIEGKKDPKILVYGNLIDAIKNAFGRPVNKYNLHITKYPGVKYTIPETPPYGCRDASFKLKWDNQNIKLGFTIIGPSGEELESVYDDKKNLQELHFDQLGECLEGENFKIVIYTLSDVKEPVNFEVEYSWKQNFSRKQGDCIASACEGAILSSIINAPLLYIKPTEIPKETIDTLYKLGVKGIYLMDIGRYLSKSCKNQLREITDIRNHFTDYKKVYEKIISLTGKNDIIFSTIDPWSYWLYSNKVSMLKPAGEYKKAFYFGPATYAASLHGSPLLIVDNHPELSGAVMWHNEFWKKNANGFTDPPVAPMHITGKRVYKFLRKIGLDKEGVESMLTVAGQYDIGPTWTRCFAGVANPGAIIGTPVDTSNHITRCIFYPGLIFENPAIKKEINLIDGSKSIRAQTSLKLNNLKPFQGITERLFARPFGSNLKIIEYSKSKNFKYPVLHTYGCYSYRFNERGGDYWGAEYETRDGIIPGRSISYNSIDLGTREKFEGIYGSFHPDISESEITPFYSSRAGYDNVYSMDFDTTLENLNKGVISWYMVLHGVCSNGGQLAWYSPTSIYDALVEKGTSPIVSKLFQALIGIPLGLTPTIESNPWRGYDQLWGSTEEPDSASLNAELGLILGWLGLANKNGPLNGGVIKTGLDLIPSNIALFNFRRDNYFDGLVGPYSITAMMTKFRYCHNAIEIDDKLENLHSMNFHANSCLIGCNYIQIAFLRHGSVLQELDPWGTSYWGGVAFQEKPRDFALGKTVGESYSNGRTKVGLKYVFEDDDEIKWWWDVSQNIVLFADPNLRIWIPSIEWDFEANNHWEWSDVEPMRYNKDFMVEGHAPYGADRHPNAREAVSWLYQYIFPIVIFIIVIILIFAGIKIIHRKDGTKF